MNNLKPNTTRLVNALKEGKRLTTAQIRSRKIGVPNPSSTIFNLRHRHGMKKIKFEGGAYSM